MIPDYIDEVERPNTETIAAMLEAERIAKDPNVKHYTDLDELFEDLRFDVAEVTPLDSGRWMVHIIKGAFTA